jgi:hypothetical protein
MRLKSRTQYISQLGPSAVLQSDSMLDHHNHVAKTSAIKILGWGKHIYVHF